MDPQTALDELATAADNYDGDPDDYRERLADLLSWYDNGEFLPGGACVFVGAQDGSRYIAYRGRRFTWWGNLE